MNSFFCNKRYDISFSDFYKLIKLILPTEYRAKDSRGLYRTEYQPCSIITIEKIDNPDFNEQIFCWLGQKGLTVLANTELTVSLCIEVLKNVKQNPEDYKVVNFQLTNYETDMDLISLSKSIIEHNEISKNYLVYKQINNQDNIDKYLISEYNGDEVEICLYHDSDSIRLSGAITSLFTYVLLLIKKNLNIKSE